MHYQKTSPISAAIVARSGKKLIRGHVGPAPYRVESALADTPSHTAVLNQCGAFGHAVRHPAVSELVVEGDSAHREEAVESVLFEERQRERVAHVACVGIPPRSTPVVGGLPRAKVIQAATLKFSFACSRSFPCNHTNLRRWRRMCMSSAANTPLRLSNLKYCRHPRRIALSSPIVRKSDPPRAL